MAELEQELETNRSEERIKQLSGKVEMTAKERDEQAQLAKESAEKAATAEKERDFYKGFADEVAKNPAARDLQDEIKSKVMAGYSLEDATIASLAKAGKLQSTAPVVERENPAGGSAATNAPQGGTKTVAEMSRDEKRAALLDAEKRGDLAVM